MSNQFNIEIVTFKGVSRKFDRAIALIASLILICEIMFLIGQSIYYTIDAVGEGALLLFIMLIVGLKKLKILKIVSIYILSKTPVHTQLLKDKEIYASAKKEIIQICTKLDYLDCCEKRKINPYIDPLIGFNLQVHTVKDTLNNHLKDPYNLKAAADFIFQYDLAIKAYQTD